MIINKDGDRVIEAKDVDFNEWCDKFKFENFEIEYDIKDHGKGTFDHNDPLADYGLEITNDKFYEIKEGKKIEIEEQDLPFIIDWSSIVEYLDKHVGQE